MSLIKVTCKFFLIATLILNSTLAFGKDIFVYALNEGMQNGTFENAYKTIQQAADAAAPGDRILVRSGIYREEVNIPVSNLTFMKYENDVVVINGTEKLSSWTLASGSTYVSSQMAWNCDPFDGGNQLFVDGKMINLARWPKQTSEDIIKPSDGKASSVEISGNYIIITDNNFNEPDGRWAGAQVWINTSGNGHDGQGWTGVVVSTSQANKTITIDYRAIPEPANQPWGFAVNSEYFLFNPTSEGVNATGGVDALLAPGEWWKDIDNKVYVKLPNQLAPGDPEAVVNVVEAKRRLFAFIPKSSNLNVNNITIKNFEFFACAITTDRGYNTRISQTPGFGPFKPVIVEDAYNYLIENINAKYVYHFTNQQGDRSNQWVARSGFILSGVNNIIQNCTIQYSAGSAISMMGRGNKILNNLITEANYMNTNSGAINSGKLSYDCEIGYNIISNTPMQAIKIDGFINSNFKNRGVARIHHNKISNFLRRGWDSGAIDEVAEDGQYVRIDHNEIFNTMPDAIHGEGRFALYFDFGADPDLECQGRYIVDHNVIYDVNVAMQTNSLRNLLVYNNVLLSINPDCSMSNGASNPNSIAGGFEDTIQNNIMNGLPNIWDTGNAGMSKAYIRNNVAYKTAKTYNSSIVTGNTLYNTREEIMALFVDPDNHNYQLKSTAIDAIDKGVSFAPFDDIINNNKVDIGAFELNSNAWVAGPTNFLPPLIYPNGGEFNDSVIVNLVSEKPGVTIRYTLNGDDPDLNSLIYTGPFSIKDTTFLKVRAFESNSVYSDVQYANFNVTIRNLPLREAENPVNLLPGLNYEYYEYSSNLNPAKLPDLNMWIPSSHDTVSRISNYKANRGEYYCMKFTGYISVPVDGVYTFFTFSDDASKLFIGEDLIVDNDYIYSNVVERSGMIGLKAGFHKIEVQYLQAINAGSLSVMYQGSTITKRTIPLSAIWHKTYENTVAKVNITPQGGKFYEKVDITMESATEGATIYYTIDGSEPGLSSLVYSSPVTISSSTILKAIAVKDGFTQSKTASVSFISSVADVVISIDHNTVTLTCPTPDALIYYTIDKSVPSATSALYTGPFSVTLPVTINAIAYKAPLVESNITTKTAKHRLLATESFNYTAGTTSRLEGKGAVNAGWESAWTISGGKAIITQGNLGVDTIGNKVVTSVFTSQAEFYRVLSAPWLMDGSTYWLRFYFQRNPSTASSMWGGISLFDKTKELLFIGAPYMKSIVGFDGNPNSSTHFTSVSDELVSNILVKLITDVNGQGNAYMWIDYDADTEPSISEAIASQRFPRNDDNQPVTSTSFNRIRIASDASNSFSFDGIVLSNEFFPLNQFPIPNSVKKVVTNDEFLVYPNPVTNKSVTINLLSDKMDKYTVSVHDLSGASIFQTSEMIDKKLTISLPDNLKPGLYILKIMNNKKVMSKKLIIN